MSHSVYNFTDSGAPVEKLATLMETESVQYGPMDSAVRDRRTHWMAVLTKVGVSVITAVIGMMSLSNVIIQVWCKCYSSNTRRLDHVNMFVFYLFSCQACSFLGVQECILSKNILLAGA